MLLETLKNPKNLRVKEYIYNVAIFWGISYDRSQKEIEAADLGDCKQKQLHWTLLMQYLLFPTCTFPSARSCVITQPASIVFPSPTSSHSIAPPDGRRCNANIAASIWCGFGSTVERLNISTKRSASAPPQAIAGEFYRLSPNHFSTLPTIALVYRLSLQNRCSTYSPNLVFSL